VKLALMTAMSGGTGINLDGLTGQHPRLMLMMTQPYAGDKFEQTIGRVSRRDTASASEVRILRIPGSSADAHGTAILAPKLTALHAAQAGADPSQSKLEADQQRPQAARDEYNRAREGKPGAAPADWTAVETGGPRSEADEAVLRHLASSEASSSDPTLAEVLKSIAGRMDDPELDAVARVFADVVPKDVVVTSLRRPEAVTAVTAAIGITPERLAQYHGLYLYKMDEGGEFIRPAFVGVNPNAANPPAQIVLHEATHVLTEKALRFDSRRGDRRLARALAALYWDVRASLRAFPVGSSIRYAGRNWREVMAQGFSDPATKAGLETVRLNDDCRGASPAGCHPDGRRRSVLRRPSCAGTYSVSVAMKEQPQLAICLTT
jgi:hypothetical protein